MNSPEKTKRIANKAGGVGGIGDRLPVAAHGGGGRTVFERPLRDFAGNPFEPQQGHLWPARAQGGQLAPQVLAGINPDTMTDNTGSVNSSSRPRGITFFVFDALRQADELGRREH
jgi:hypothetical protein